MFHAVVLPVAPHGRVPTDVVLLEVVIHCMAVSLCEGVLCLEGSSVRSPGSWQGGSWVSALLGMCFAGHLCKILLCGLVFAFFHEQDHLIRQHTCCGGLLEPSCQYYLVCWLLGFLFVLLCFGVVCLFFLFCVLFVLFCFASLCLLTRPRVGFVCAPLLNLPKRDTVHADA